MKFLKQICGCLALAFNLTASANAALFTEWNFNGPSDFEIPGGLLAPSPSLGAGTASVVGSTFVENFSTAAADGGSSDPAIFAPPNYAWQTRGYPAQGTNNKTAGAQFMVSTAGWENVVVEYDLRHSNTSSRYEQFQFTINGGASWLDFGPPLAGASGDTWFNNRTFDLSSVAGVVNNPNFGFQIVATFAPATSQYQASNTGSTYATTGSWRFDMVQVNGAALPPFNWYNPSGGSFHTAANWTGVVVPSVNDPAIFDLNSNGYTVTANQDITTGGLTVRSDNVTLSLGSHTWAMPQNNSLVMFVGDQASDVGKLILTSGTLATGRTYIGYEVNAHGTLVVDGPSAVFSVANSALFAGGNGTSQGTVEVRNGGKIAVSGTDEPNFYVAPTPNSMGSVSVAGTDSKLEVSGILFVGERGTGILDVASGGRIEVGSLLVGGTTIGPNPASSGIVNVQAGGKITGQFLSQIGRIGSGSMTINGGVVDILQQINVGGGSTGEGTGTVVISGGGTLTTAIGTSPTGTSGVVGRSLGSHGTVQITGTGSHWTNEGMVRIGNAGIGVLHVDAGGLIDSLRGQLGDEATGNGTVTIDGNASRWNVIQDVTVGGTDLAQAGQGLVEVSNGGRIAIGQTLRIWPTGEVDVTGGGTIEIGSVAVPMMGTVQVGTGGTLSGNGFVTGNVLVTGGSVTPGSSPGTLTITGNYSQNAGTLNLEIAGIANGAFDVLDVTGNLQLGGALQVALLSFTPAIGDSFDLLDWTGSLSGTFATLQLPALPAGRIWKTSQLYATGELQVAAAPPGDFDSDGDVDGADFVIWQTNFPAASGHVLATGDADGDGDVDGADFVVWQTNFPFSPGPAAAPVPEPAGASFVLTAFGVLVLRKRWAVRK